jgi:predicted transposase/invertase (TIGR01784 family)
MTTGAKWGILGFQKFQEDMTLTKTDDILSPKDDFVFHKLFADQNHVNMIIPFLTAFSDLRDDECANLMVANPNLIPAVKEGKTCILDLKLRTSTGQSIHVEIQRAYAKYMGDRMAVYGGRAFGEQLQAGEEYKKVKRLISALIVDFPMLKKREDYHTRFMLRSDDGRIVLTEALEFHILELCKIPVSEDGQRLWPWLKFFTSKTKEEFMMLQQNYAELQKPVARLMELSADEVVRMQKDAWERARWDEAARIRTTKDEIAMNLRKEGIPVSVIAKATGLSPEEIAALSEEE